jgi:hypothetical protein
MSGIAFIAIVLAISALTHHGVPKQNIVVAALSPSDIAIHSTEVVQSSVGLGSTFHNEITAFATNHRQTSVVLSCSVVQARDPKAVAQRVNGIGPIAPGGTRVFSATVPDDLKYRDSYVVRCVVSKS